MKIRFRVLFRRCERNKETFKLYGLAGVAPHSLCIKHDKLAPRKFDLTLDHASNNPLSPEEVRDVLALWRTSQKKLWSKQKISSIKSSKSTEC